MAVFAALSLFFSLFFSCKQEPDDPVVSEISVALKEQGKVFIEGDTLSKEDVAVTALYSDGKTRDVTNRVKFTPELPQTLAAPAFTLTTEYEEKKAELKIEVGKKNDYYKNTDGKYIKLKEILLALKDSDKDFFEGDKISKDDFVVTAKYEDDTTKTVTEGVTFEGLTEEKLTVGKVTIKATYGSQSKSLDITVHAKGATVTSISLALKAGRTFIVDDTLFTDDFIVIATFSDGTTEDVTKKSEFTGIGKQTQADKVTIRATYESKTANCEVTIQAKTVTSISLALKQQDKIYVVDGTLSASDFIVTATYNNGTTEDVTSKSQIAGLGNLTQAGKVKITATYETKSASLDITVRASGVTLTDISLALKPNKTFVVGDTISRSDFIVTAIFSDDTTEDVTSASKFTGLGKQTQAGEVKITATYNSLSKSRDITVNAKPAEETKVVSISLALENPGRTFVVGEYIRWDDFTVIATFSDGSARNVTWDSSFEGLGKQTEAGNVKITATYSSKTASITVQVVIPETLYIYDYNETVENWEWNSMQVEKEGSCFYYEFKRTATIDFCISTSQDYSGRLGGGVAIPQTGDYVELNNYNDEFTILFFITKLGDRIYVRYENGIYYARYVSSDDESFDPDEEIKAVKNIIFDIGFNDVDNIGLLYWPEYMLEGERLKIEVKEWQGSAPCTYKYEWWRHNSDVWECVDNATLADSPDFEEGYFYWCTITATSSNNSQYIIVKDSPRFYIASMDDVSLSETIINLDNTEITKDLCVNVDRRYCDSIEWETSDPFVVALDGYVTGAWGGGRETEKVTLLALRDGEATITVTVTRRGETRSDTCTVTVSGLNVEEEKYSWWYSVLDTSEVSTFQKVGLIFNTVYIEEDIEGNTISFGDQSNDISDVKHTGEIFYKWNGKDRTAFSEVDKSTVDNLILKTDVNMEKSLVVYVCVPDELFPVNLYAWYWWYDDEGWEVSNSITAGWPGVLMKKCTENPAE